MPTRDQPLLDELFRTLKGEDKNGHNHGERGGVAGITKLTDSVVLEKLFSENKNGNKWRHVYNSDYEEYYPSPSEAIAALLWKLAFYSGNDPVQMERLLRGSGLPSEKFDSPRGGSTWLQDEIGKAVAATSETYTLKGNGQHHPGTKKGDTSKEQPSSQGNGGEETPSHDELRDLWLMEHPDSAFGLGQWRYYEEGIYHTVDEAEVKRTTWSRYWRRPKRRG
jgi:hypothetical protein